MYTFIYTYIHIRIHTHTYIHTCAHICMHAKLPQLRPTLSDPMDYSLQGSSTHGILQTRILEWVAMPSSRGSSQPRDRTCVSYVSCLGSWVLYSYYPNSVSRNKIISHKNMELQKSIKDLKER